MTEPDTIGDSAALYRGDALKILPHLPEDHVHATIVDPPYNSGGRTPNDRRAQTARGKYVSSNAAHDLPDFEGDCRDQRGYLAWLSLILADCLRITQTGGSALVFSDWRQLPVTSDALQAAGWMWRGIIAWHKPIARPFCGGFRASCEYVLWGTKGPVDAAANPVYLQGMVSASQPRGKERQHITQKPLQLVDELVKVCPPGGTVLDPCAGSGTTGVAAVRSGRRFVGVELTAKYYEIARARLAGTQLEEEAS